MHKDSHLGASVLSHLVEAKCDDSMPIYRLRDRFARLGFDVPLSALYRYSTFGLDLFLPVAEVTLGVVLDDDIVFIDDTGMPVLDKSKPGGKFRGHLWAFKGSTSKMGSPSSLPNLGGHRDTGVGRGLRTRRRAGRAGPARPSSTSERSTRSRRAPKSSDSMPADASRCARKSDLVRYGGAFAMHVPIRSGCGARDLEPLRRELRERLRRRQRGSTEP
ncbi:MAG: transposase [Nannocystaceae bacterium]